MPLMYDGCVASRSKGHLGLPIDSAVGIGSFAFMNFGLAMHFASYERSLEREFGSGEVPSMTLR